MYTYKNYSLRIGSEIEIPEFLPLASQQEVEIRCGTMQDIPPHVPKMDGFFSLDRFEAILKVEQIGTFIVRNGDTVVLIPEDGVPEDAIRRYIVGNILGILLYQRGFTVLHASCLRVNQHTIAILGDVGKGKSSLAASLLLRGHEFLSDDVTAVDTASLSFKVAPAYPLIKIHPSIAEQIGLSLEELLPICAGEEKKWFPVGARYLTSPQTLSRVYVLHNAPQVNITPASSQDIVLEYLRYSIPTRWQFSSDEKHFKDILNLAGKIKFYNLNRPKHPSMLPDVIDALEKHLETSL